MQTPFSPAEMALIAREARFCGFRLYEDARNAEEFIEYQAGIYRLANRYHAGAFDGQMPHPDWKNFGSKIQMRLQEPLHALTTNGLGYLIFDDGSLYVASNADDEVWAAGGDFCLNELPNERESWTEDDRKVWSYYMGEEQT